MGVRLYDPQLGRFLQTDPIAGGSANDYDYAGQDPVNAFDLGGTCWGWGCSAIVHVAHRAAHMASSAGRYLNNNAGSVALGFGIAAAALSGQEEIAIPLLLGSTSFGAISGVHNARRGRYAAAAEDFIGAGLGAGEVGLRAGVTAMRVLRGARAAERLAPTAARASRLSTAALYSAALTTAVSNLPGLHRARLD